MSLLGLTDRAWANFTILIRLTPHHSISMLPTRAEFAFCQFWHYPHALRRASYLLQRLCGLTQLITC